MNIIVITGLLASVSSTLLGVSAMTQPEPVQIPLEQHITLQARAYGVNEEIALAIIECESGGDINALNTTRNANKTIDYGIWQINSVHQVSAGKMGLDITKFEDNLEFGFRLMKEQGTTPWNSSKKCWGSEIA